MKRTFYALAIIIIFISGCNKEDISGFFYEDEYSYETFVLESPDGKLRVSILHNTDEEFDEQYEIYLQSLIEFQDMIYGDYDRSIEKPLRRKAGEK